MRGTILSRTTIAGILSWASLVARGDTITFQHDGKVRKVQGNVLTIGQGETLLFEGRDGQHFVVHKNQRDNWVKDNGKVGPYARAELQNKLREEFGGRYYQMASGRYHIVYSCSLDYAKDAGKLLERAYTVFTTYFSAKGGFRFEKPQFPLIVVICGSREEYLTQITKHLGARATSTSGVYMPASNRMYMYDHLGSRLGAKRRPLGEQAMLREQNVAVIVHEAIHQIAFNTGFHSRLVNDYPAWLIEGMATFFETPDLDARGGWKGAGVVNRERLLHLQRYPERLTKGFLKNLILDDQLFRDPDTGLDAYAQAWGLTYYINRTRVSEYARYIRRVNDRPVFTPYSPEDRLKDFRDCFGDLDILELNMKRFVLHIKP